MNESTHYLEKFTENLTRKVLQDPQRYVAPGRAKELRQVSSILNQDIKSSPVLVGEAGTGKTAIIEALAVELVQQPEQFHKIAGKEILMMTMAGFMTNGDGANFARNLEATLNELIANNDKYLVFIDEIHQIVGAGADNGSAVDAGNILKPALSRGDISLIGATTIKEFHQYIETDDALMRRFDRVDISEMAQPMVVDLLDTIKNRFETSKGVEVPTDLLPVVVEYADRYMTLEHFPDKAITLLDRATTEAMMAGHTVLSQSDVTQVLNERFDIPLPVLNETGDQRLANLYDNLTRHVIGQDAALKRITGRLKAKAAGLNDNTKPTSLWLGGPTGVGKTEAAKQLAIHYFGSEDALIRFDMSEFRPGPGIHDRFRERLTSEVQRRPYSIILFDEVEKAIVNYQSDVMDLLLQVLDDGRLSDDYGRTINFKDTVILFTSNVGHKAIEEFAAKNEAFRSDERRLKSLEDEYEMAMLGAGFRQEFITRIGTRLIFQPLTSDSILKIIDLQLEKLARQTAKKGYYLVFKPEQVAEFIPTFLNHSESSSDGKQMPSWPIADYLLDVGYRASRGVRPLQEAIEYTISQVMSEAILNDRLSGSHENNAFIFRAVGQRPDKTHPHGSWEPIYSQALLTDDEYDELQEVQHGMATI